MLRSLQGWEGLPCPDVATLFPSDRRRFEIGHRRGTARTTERVAKSASVSFLRGMIAPFRPAARALLRIRRVSRNYSGLSVLSRQLTR